MTTPRAYRRQAEATDDRCAALEAQLAEARAEVERLRVDTVPGLSLQLATEQRRAEKAEAEVERLTGVLDIIQRENEGEDETELAIQYGGLHYEQHPACVSTRKVRERAEKAEAEVERLRREYDVREVVARCPKHDSVTLYESYQRGRVRMSCPECADDENAALRAEVERLRKERASWKATAEMHEGLRAASCEAMKRNAARAEKAEAEVERLRLRHRAYAERLSEECAAEANALRVRAERAEAMVIRLNVNHFAWWEDNLRELWREMGRTEELPEKWREILDALVLDRQAREAKLEHVTAVLRGHSHHAGCARAVEDALAALRETP